MEFEECGEPLINLPACSPISTESVNSLLTGFLEGVTGSKTWEGDAVSAVCLAILDVPLEGVVPSDAAAVFLVISGSA